MRTGLSKATMFITASLVVLPAAAHCASSSTSTVGGVLSGLTQGGTVVLVNNGGDPLILKSNGAFTFSKALASGRAYDVTLTEKPKDEVCTVGNGSGSADLDVTDVEVNCFTTHPVGGTVSGLLLNETLILLDNSGDPLRVMRTKLDGNKPFSFTFSTLVGEDSAYNVTVGTQPDGQVCTVASGAGLVGRDDVTNVAVTCATGYSVGGTVTGLSSGAKLTIEDNAGNLATVVGASSNKVTFAFSELQANGASYDVTIGTQPVNQTCSVTQGSGTIHARDFTGVSISCLKNLFTVGGSVAGLAKHEPLILLDNGGNALRLVNESDKNLAFTFTDRLSDNEPYDVTVGTQPDGQACNVTNGSGVVAGSKDVTDVSVKCEDVYTIGGTINGLPAGETLVLLNNGGEPESVIGSGQEKESFAFSTDFASGAPYKVTVGTQPLGAICAVASGTGKVSSGNVTTIAVTCRMTGSTVGGSVQFNGAGGAVTLLVNGGTAFTVSSSSVASVDFIAPLVLKNGSSYAVTVSGTSPAGEKCTVIHGSGKMSNYDVTDVEIVCSAPLAYTVGGTVEFTTPGSVTLLLNGGNFFTVSSATAGSVGFVAGLTLLNEARYSVTVSSVTPATDSCNVSDGIGYIQSADVTNIQVSCRPPTYTVGGTVDFVTSGGSVTLLLNGGNPVNVTSGSSGTVGFIFDLSLLNAAPYTITVSGATPTGESCRVTSGGTGSIAGASVTNVVVTCQPPVFTVGGTVDFVTSGGSVALLLDGGNALPVSSGSAATVSFTFPLNLANQAPYAVTVGGTGPTGESCTVTGGGSGTIKGANVTNVAVTCNPPVPPTYSIAGTVTGLTSSGGSVILTNDSANATTVTYPNGSFIFSNIANNSPYDIEVSVQPTGETCTPSNNTGTVSGGNVTGVLVSCSPSISGSGAYYIPFTAMPDTNLPEGDAGATGLFLMNSSEIASGTTPSTDLQWVTAVPTQILAVGANYSAANGAITGMLPAVMMYSAIGGDGNLHMYGLNLSDTSQAATPSQVGSLSVDPATNQICPAIGQGQKDLTDATSLFVVLHVTVASSQDNPAPCISGARTYYVVQFTDGASVAPFNPNIFPEYGINPVYSDGVMTGIIMADWSQEEIFLFTDDTFTSHSTLVESINNYTVATASINDGTPFGKNEVFIDVTEGLPPTLFLLTPGSTQSTVIVEGDESTPVLDDNNAYFIDTSSSTTTVIYQAALSDGTVTKLYSGPATVNIGSPAQQFDVAYQLIGSNDSALMFYTNIVSPDDESIPPQTGTIYSIPVGTLSTTPTTIGGPYNGDVVSAFLAQPKVNDLADSVLFANITFYSGQSYNVYAYSSVAVPPAGPYGQTPTANSFYVGASAGAPLANQLSLNYSYSDSDGFPVFGQPSGLVYQIQGITETDGGFGGGNFYQVAVSNTPTATELTSTGGTYVIPSAPAGAEYTIGGVPGPESTPGSFGFLNNNVAMGAVATSNYLNPTDYDSIGLLIDTSKAVLLPVAVPYTNVTPF